MDTKINDLPKGVRYNESSLYPGYLSAVKVNVGFIFSSV